VRVDRDLLALGRGLPGDGPVVVLRALGLGDLLVAVPALRALARALGGREIRLVTPRALAPLVALVPGGATLRVVGAAGLERLPAEARDAALAVNLHGSGPQSHRLLLAGGARRLLAFAHPEVPQARDGPAWDGGEHEAARWCRLLAHAGVAADPLDLRLSRPAAADGHPCAGATVIHPGAASGSRRWPPERFAAVARAERRAGRRVVVTGGPDEAALAGRVARDAGLPPAAVLAGRTSVAGLAALVAAAGRVVCGDTGVAHLATAFGTPSVVLFGPTPPQAWGPPAALADRHRVVWAGLRGDPHGDAPDPGLLRIGPERVLDELARI
jgi:ADP-heptose:LPS heptosyltransferase